MLEEFTGDVLVYMIVFRKLQGDAHEVQCIHGHPAGAVGLVDVAAGGQLRAAVEYSDVVQAQKSALENIGVDRKSTRLNSSHQIISYAVFCLKKKKKTPAK